MSEDYREHMDLEYLREICGGNQVIMGRLLEVFREQMPALLSELEDHHANGAGKELAKVAHKAKSSVAILGMRRTKDALSFIEKYAHTTSYTNEVAASVQSVLQACRIVLVELEEYRSTRAA